MKILFITNTILTGLLALIMAFFYFTQKTFPGFRQWTIGGALIACAFLMVVLRGLVPASLAIILQNFVYVLAPVLYLKGMRRFLDLPDMPPGWYALPAIGGLFSIFSVCCFDSAPWRTLVDGLAFSVAHVATATIIFKDFSKTKSIFSVVLGAEMMLASALLLIWAMWSFTISDFELLMVTPVHVGFFISLMVLQIIITFSFVMLNVERANTELVSAQDALKFSEEKFSKAFHSTPDSITISRMADGKIIEVNAAFSAISGYSRDEALSRSAIDLNLWPHQQDREKIVSMLRDKMTVNDQEINFRAKAGKILHCLFSAETLLLNGEEYVLSVVRDISERKRWEQDLQTALQRFYAVLASANTGLLLVTNEDTVEFVNQAMCDMFDIRDQPSSLKGLSAREMIGRLADAYAHPEAILNRIKEVVTQNEPVRGEEVATRDGRTYLVDYVPIDIDGNPYGRLWVHTDITKRKKMEDDLRASEERYRIVADFTYNWECWLDTEGKFVYVSPSCKRITGYSRDEFLNNPALFESIIHPDDRTVVVEHLKASVTDRLPDVEALEFRILDDKGRVRWIEHSCQRVSGDTGKPLGRRASHADISHRKQAEQEKELLKSQLIQSQKMEAVGTLAAGIAHDFNNMLQVILGYSDLLLSEMNEGSPEHEKLQRIIKTALQASDLVQKIRIFSRKADIQPVALALNHQLQELASLLTHTLLKTIDINVQLAEDLWIIKADPGLMDQMVSNLAINASEAMPEGGTLTIETQNAVLDDDFCKAHAGAKPGLYVLLTISDTGTGMSLETRERIFDPFFSTKPRDYHRGTGLGLSIVKGIVDEHGGYITVESQLGRGATFRIYFPILTTQEIPKAEAKVDFTATGGETILLVEDEELVRNLEVSILERAGYQVLAVADGLEALDVYAKQRDNIALVILDIVMPRMDGQACLRELMKINPAVKVLISSGVAQDDRVKEVVDLGAKGSLLKPYSIKALQAKVQELIDSE